MTTRKVYIAELEDMAENVSKMGTRLEHMIDQVIEALKNMDIEEAEELIREDDIIDQMEREIERSCINIVAKAAAGSYRSAPRHFHHADDLRY